VREAERELCTRGTGECDIPHRRSKNGPRGAGENQAGNGFSRLLLALDYRQSPDSILRNFRAASGAPFFAAATSRSRA
jgi:hypothetical protein